MKTRNIDIPYLVVVVITGAVDIILEDAIIHFKNKNNQYNRLTVNSYFWNC